jgi:hypothetical protein
MDFMDYMKGDLGGRKWKREVRLNFIFKNEKDDLSEFRSQFKFSGTDQNFPVNLEVFSNFCPAFKS